MKKLSKEDVKHLDGSRTGDDGYFVIGGIEQDQIPVSPGIEHEIKSRLKIFPQDKAASVAWENANGD